MHHKKISAMQKEYGYSELQKSINSGQCWHMEGSQGRAAMSALESGMCMLPTVDRTNAYGGIVPSRNRLKPGTKGTLKNCSDFWDGVDNGSIFLSKE